MNKTILTIAIATMACACANDESGDDAFRLLPVAAIAEDGSEILVGTYDEESGELELVSTFVDEMAAMADAPVDVANADQNQRLASLTTWTMGLEEGSELALMVRDAGVLRGATLVVHAEEWTDSLTEVQAQSSFAACWDPEPCTIDIPDQLEPIEPIDPSIDQDPLCDPFPLPVE